MSYAIPARLAVIAQRGGALERFWKDYQASEYRIEGLECSLLAVEDGKRLEDLDDERLLLILTDVEAIQRRAVRLKLRRRAPVIVLRFEGDDDAALARIQKDFRRVLLEAKPDVHLPF